MNVLANKAVGGEDQSGAIICRKTVTSCSKEIFICRFVVSQCVKWKYYIE